MENVDILQLMYYDLTGYDNISICCHINNRYATEWLAEDVHRQARPFE